MSLSAHYRILTPLRKLKNYSLLWYSNTICFKLSKNYVKMSNPSAEINCILSEEWVTAIHRESRKIFSPVWAYKCQTKQLVGCGNLNSMVITEIATNSFNEDKKPHWLLSLLMLKIKTFHVTHFKSAIPIQGILWIGHLSVRFLQKESTNHWTEISSE